MANEVKIKLTDAQKEKIREATGKDMPEIRVENFGNNPALSPTEKSVSQHVSAVRRAPMRKAFAKKAPVRKAFAKKAPMRKAFAKKAPMRKAFSKRAPARKG